MRKLSLLIAAMSLISIFRSEMLLAEPYPSRPVRVIVPFSVGGTSDLIARVVFDKIGEQSNLKAVVENRPGGAGNIATEVAIRSAPDGYTLYLADPTGFLAANVTLFPKTSFNAANDLTPITLIGTTRSVVVASKKLPVQTISDLIALAKSKPGEVRFGSTGIGSPGHLNGELFKRLVGIEMTHIPYRLIPQGNADLLSGQISLWIGPIPTLISLIRSEQLSALAVSGDTRSSELPNVPTVKELGLGDFDVTNLYAIYVPKGTPPDIIETIKKEVEHAVAAPDVLAKLKNAGVEVATGDAQFLKDTLDKNVKRWADVITQAKIIPN